MTIHFVGGLLIGFGLTMGGILSIVGYLYYKSIPINEITNERNHYKKFYDNYRDRVDSGH